MSRPHPVHIPSTSRPCPCTVAPRSWGCGSRVRWTPRRPSRPCPALSTSCPLAPEPRERGSRVRLTPRPTCLPDCVPRPVHVLSAGLGAVGCWFLGEIDASTDLPACRTAPTPGPRPVHALSTPCPPPVRSAGDTATPRVSPAVPPTPRPATNTHALHRRALPPFGRTLRGLRSKWGRGVVFQQI